MLIWLYNWWLCFNEPGALHRTKIEFFRKAKEAKLANCNALWSVAKVFYQDGLIVEDLDKLIASVKGEMA